MVGFDYFEEMVLSILTDPDLIQQQSYVALPKCQCMDGEDTAIKSCMDTSSYVSAYQHLHVNAEDIIFPIQLFIDKTHINEQARLKLEPVIFTFTLFNQETKIRRPVHGILYGTLMIWMQWLEQRKHGRRKEPQ